MRRAQVIAAKEQTVMASGTIDGRRFHVCTYNFGECEECARLVHDDAWRQIRGMRGRWMVVYEGSQVVRHSSRRRAIGEVRCARELGCAARLVRYRRDRVIFDEENLSVEVSDGRWLP